MRINQLATLAFATTLWIPSGAGETLPGFVKKPTWQDSMIANRESLAQSETAQDARALEAAGVTLGTWFVLGPVSAKSKDVQEILSANTLVDLTRRYQIDGKDIGWQPCAGLRDGQLNDLTDRIIGKDSVILACRAVILPKGIGNDKIGCGMAADQAHALWLSTKARRDCARSAALQLADGNNLNGDEKGNQILVSLSANAEGKCRFYFALMSLDPQAGAGDKKTRMANRQKIHEQVRTEFATRADQAQIDMDVEAGLWLTPDGGRNDWLPGRVEEYLKSKYLTGAKNRLAEVRNIQGETAGVRAAALAAFAERLKTHADVSQKSLEKELGVAQLRAGYYQLSMVRDLMSMPGRLESMRMAVNDHRTMFKERYPKAETYLTRIAATNTKAAALLDELITHAAPVIGNFMELKNEIDDLQAAAMLDTPLLGFDKLLIMKGRPSFRQNWEGPNTLGNEMVVLSPVRPDGTQTTIYKGGVSDMDLHWDGNKILFSDGRVLREMNADGSGLRQVSLADPPVSHYDACYLPNGKIVCVSDACEQAVPCTGGAGVGNLHLMDADGRNERRLSYDQDHDWNPVVLNDGQVLYTRWEYTDLPHYFSRILFRMHPDGAGQVEYYGSGSYWPNGIFWPRPIPGDPSAIVGVISGHHGVARAGELLIFDPSKGRQEAQGVVQRIPGYGVKVKPVIADGLVNNSWPRFATPYPLAEPKTHLGAGKYFLACVQNKNLATWNLCLVDIFDNITPILTGGYMAPIPLRERPLPPVIASKLNPNQNDAVIYVADVYQGGGLRGYPKGSIKSLRVGTHHYRYNGNGDTSASSMEGGWDVKRILGTVPVEADGSASFRVPANTPIFLQPLDAEGKAQQLMRSWYTAMPGETGSCIGCHESQNTPPLVKPGLAMGKPPVNISPWNGPARGFSFDREVQPVLDHRCVGCHDGKPYKIGDKMIATEDLRAKQLRPDYKGNYSPAYLVMQKYVRRAGFESDMHMHVPAEFDADTSALVQMIKKGHYNVQLTPAEWERIYAWIDYNVPYPANWSESHRPPTKDQVAKRAKYKKLYANLDDRDEDPLPLPPVADFEAPKPEPARPAPIVGVENWPMTTEEAKVLQENAGDKMMDIDLGDGVTMKFCLIPAGRFVMGNNQGFSDEYPQAVVRIEKPFYLGQMEVTLKQYARFNPEHENGFIEGRGKDRSNRGVPMDVPDYPVMRISWNEAMAYCKWLSRKSGHHCTLPDEAQWEWACRAGTSSTYAYGEFAAGRHNVANINSNKGWNHGRAEEGYNDSAPFLSPGARFPANAWGLHDMHGNVAEWCLSSYKAYPYVAGDGRNDPESPGLKVIRGGSWNDNMRYAASASRWRYQAYQPACSTGFRVLVTEVKPKAGKVVTNP